MLYWVCILKEEIQQSSYFLVWRIIKARKATQQDLQQIGDEMARECNIMDREYIRYFYRDPEDTPLLEADRRTQ